MEAVVDRVEDELVVGREPRAEVDQEVGDVVGVEPDLEDRLLDPASIAAQNTRDGRAPRFVQVRDHNHTSIVAHLDTGDDSLGREILQFLHEIDPSP